MFSSKVNKHKPKQNQKTFLSILSFLQEFFSGEDQRSIFSQVRLKWTLQVRQGFSLWPDPCTLTPVLSIRDWFEVSDDTNFTGTNAVASWGSFECNYFLANSYSIPPKPLNSSLSGLVNKSSQRIKRDVFQIRQYGKTIVLSDQVRIYFPAYSTHDLQQSKQIQTKAKSENVFVHSFIPSRIFQRRRSIFRPS